MSNFDLSRLWTNMGLVVGSPKRAQPSQLRWGFETERLEERALLSASMGTGVETAPVELSVGRQKQAAAYPNLVGTWVITGTGTTTASGNVVVANAGSDDLTATFTLTGLPTVSAHLDRKNAKLRAEVSATGLAEDLHLKGKYNRNHDQISLSGVVRDSDNKKVKVDLVFTFNSNTNPNSFTATLTASNGVSFTLAGSRDLI